MYVRTRSAGGQRTSPAARLREGAGPTSLECTTRLQPRAGAGPPCVVNGRRAGGRKAEMGERTTGCIVIMNQACSYARQSTCTCAIPPPYLANRQRGIVHIAIDSHFSEGYGLLYHTSPGNVHSKVVQPAHTTPSSKCQARVMTGSVDSSLSSSIVGILPKNDIPPTRTKNGNAPAGANLM